MCIFAQQRVRESRLQSRVRLSHDNNESIYGKIDQTVLFLVDDSLSV